jgi:predicted regulator of Ras-like GTPase activity (Roadblock/LC7/MglB family)
MPTYGGKVDKRMQAENVGLLRHLLEGELEALREVNAFDLALFLGVDGRIFASSIPPRLEPAQYRLLNLVKGNLDHICGQLRRHNLKLSFQQYDAGTVVISGVGDRAFLVLLAARPMDVGDLGDLAKNVLAASQVTRHVFEQRPVSPEALDAYDAPIREELQRLTRRLFVDKFEETREYRRNQELLAFLRERLRTVVGVGPVEEILTLAFHEVGTTAPYMTEAQWHDLLEFVGERVRAEAGDAVGERCVTEWSEAMNRILRSFV